MLSILDTEPDHRYELRSSIIHVIRLKSLARFNDIQLAADLFSLPLSLPFSCSPRMDPPPTRGEERNIRLLYFRQKSMYLGVNKCRSIFFFFLFQSRRRVINREI